MKKALKVFINFNDIKNLKKLLEKRGTFMDKKKLLEVLSTENPLKSFIENKTYLKDVTFLIFDNDNNHIPELKEISYGEYKLQGLAPYNNALILNEKIFEKEKSELKIKIIVHFDSNIITRLGEFFFNRESLKNSADFIKILNFIKENGITPTCEPYLVERILNDIPIPKEVDKRNEIYKNLLAFELLNSKYSIEKEKSISDFKNISSEIILGADEKFNYILNNKEKIKKNEHYFVIYSMLLKTSIIKKSGNLVEENKKRFVNFILKECGVFLEKESILCLLYLEDKLEKYNLKSFFNLKSIREIKNVSWDLFHTRYLEQKMAENSDNNNNSYVFNFFFTHDKKLNRYIDFNYIKRMAFYKEQAYTFYSKNLEKDNFENYKDLFFEKEKIINSDINYKELSKKLEIELENMK